MCKLPIYFIVAVANNNVIGIGNDMPWHLPADLQYFKKITTGNIVVMGRKTYEAIGNKLPDRISIVFTRHKELSGVISVNSIDSFWKLLDNNQEEWKDKEVYVIGGAELFKLFLPYTAKIYLTRIHHTFAGDTCFPEIDETEWNIEAVTKGIRNDENDYNYEFIVYKRSVGD